jgi:hypothetical protein
VIKSRRMRWAGQIERMGEMRNAYIILVRQTERKRPLGRSGHKWEEDNIRIDLNEIGLKLWTECIWIRLGISGGLF